MEASTKKVLEQPKFFSLRKVSDMRLCHVPLPDLCCIWKQAKLQVQLPNLFALACNYSKTRDGKEANQARKHLTWTLFSGHAQWNLSGAKDQHPKCAQGWFKDLSECSLTGACIAPSFDQSCLLNFHCFAGELFVARVSCFSCCSTLRTLWIRHIIMCDKMEPSIIIIVQVQAKVFYSVSCAHPQPWPGICRPASRLACAKWQVKSADVQVLSICKTVYNSSPNLQGWKA